MKFGIAFLVLLIGLSALHLSAIVTKSAWFTSAVYLSTYMLVAGSFAGLAQSNKRPFWIAYVSATSIFIILFMIKNAPLNSLVIPLLVYVQPLLPAADGDANYFPFVNLQISLETLLPPAIGYLTGCMVSFYIYFFNVNDGETKI